LLAVLLCCLYYAFTKLALRCLRYLTLIATGLLRRFDVVYLIVPYRFCCGDLDIASLAGLLNDFGLGARGLMLLRSPRVQVVLQLPKSAALLRDHFCRVAADFLRSERYRGNE